VCGHGSTTNTEYKAFNPGAELHGRGDWNDRYRSVEHLFSAEPDSELVSRAARIPAGHAVDLGAGEGRNSFWLARAGWQVTAVDFSEVALARLRERAAKEGLPVEVVDADLDDYLRRGEQYDLVVLANLHRAPDERRQMFEAAAGAVASGGYLFVVGHHLDALGQAGPPDGDRLYTERRLEGAFPGLEVLEMNRCERAHGDVDRVPVVDLVVWATRRPV
jgi:SAM-dependent methyltransferase